MDDCLISCPIGAGPSRQDHRQHCNPSRTLYRQAFAEQWCVLQRWEFSLLHFLPMLSSHATSTGKFWIGATPRCTNHRADEAVRVMRSSKRNVRTLKCNVLNAEQMKITSLPQRIKFCLSIIHDNRGWIPVLLDCKDPAMQRLKNWTEVLFT